MYVKKSRLAYAIFSALIFVLSFQLNAQVGIGTTTPDPSAVLDITSTTQGLLAPRMTTAERTAIATPAQGLMVFDTDLDAFYYFDGAVWVEMITGDVKRSNYKLIKSTDVLSTVLADELAAGGGTTYLLDENTLYEINGRIDFDLPIDLNNSYITGNDTNEDIITASGGPVLFEGSNGGSLRSLTVFANLGSSVFNLNLGANQRLVVQSLVMAGLGSGTVGTISSTAGNDALVFISTVQFALFTNGITFNNIDTVLVDNVGWLANNTGTMETFSGTFDLITQIGGFFTVDSGETGIDVSSNPVINENASLETITFTGAGNYINGYTTGTYANYNFNINWDVNCNGIRKENDFLATGNTFFDRDVVATTIATETFGIPLEGTSITDNLFRMAGTKGAINDNILVYEGTATRTFNVRSSISFQTTSGNGNTIFAFYIVRFDSTDNVVEIPKGTEIFREITSGNVVGAVSIDGTVILNPGDYVRVYVQRISGNRINLQPFSFSLSLD